MIKYAALLILLASCGDASDGCWGPTGSRSCTDGTWTCTAVRPGVCSCVGPDGGVTGLETTELCERTAP